ncbi:MAG: hypothetical protein ACK4SY_05220 [Pyrobaculum sp.]
MRLFSNLKLALFGLLVTSILIPAAGASLFKKLLIPAVGLWLLARFIHEDF